MLPSFFNVFGAVMLVTGFAAMFYLNPYTGSATVFWGLVLMGIGFALGQLRRIADAKVEAAKQAEKPEE